MRRSAWALLAAAALIAGCGGGTGGFITQPTPTPVATTPAPSPTPTPATTATPTPPPALLPPAGKIYLGAYVNPKGTPQPGNVQLADLEHTIGRRFALSMHYYPFSGNGTSAFPGSPEADDVANGRVPIESWDCAYPDVQIAAGQYDTVLAAQARSLKAFGYPIFVRYMWDPNLPSSALGRQSCWDVFTDSPNGAFSPGEYIAAWNHIRSIFAAAGATNVVWLWSAYSNGVSPVPYYPGQSAADWVGMDAYNLAPGSFTSTYQQLYVELTPLGKPILVSETGTPPATQSTFFTNGAGTLETTFPLVDGWVYYDAVDPQTNDWRLGTAGTTAFTTMANNSYLSAYAALSPAPAARVRRSLRRAP